MQIDLAALPTAEQLNNPRMINVRLAALTLTRTKAELIDYVRQLEHPPSLVNRRGIPSGSRV